MRCPSNSFSQLTSLFVPYIALTEIQNDMLRKKIMIVRPKIKEPKLTGGALYQDKKKITNKI
jgi:hypothetical protein